jgi:hypothetical protein
MIEDQRVSFDTAKLAREKKYDELCTKVYSDTGNLQFSYYATTRNSEIDHGCSATAPTQTGLSKWLREVHKLEVTVYSCASGYLWDISKTNGTFVAYSDDRGPNAGGCWDNYEATMEAGLFAALERLEV